LLRLISVQTGTRVQSFRDAVRSRDRRCVVSGKKALGADFGVWTGLQAAHIFPLAYEGRWKEYGFSRWISLQSPTGDNINSVQNGLLLTNTIHSLFDNYSFSINPDVRIPNLTFSVKLQWLMIISG
jgi:hypothetical protein